MATVGGVSPDPPEIAAYRAADRRLFEDHLRPLVTPELVAEHRHNPFGPHSPHLERILLYLRRNHGEQRGQYGIVALEPDQLFGVVVLSGDRQTPPERVPDLAATSRAEAEHMVFCRRLSDLGVPVFPT